MNKIQIGILDFGFRSGKITPIKTLQDIFDYISCAEDLGITRFWLSEHHTKNKYAAWNNPEILLATLAARTKKIKVGAAGILLSFHSPYRVALSFKMLSTIFRNRIDLGIAKGYIDFNIVPYLLDENKSNEPFHKKLEKLNSFFDNDNFLLSKEIVIPPFYGSIPELWTLSTTCKGLSESLEFGTNFCISFFHNSSDQVLIKETLEDYRKTFYEKFNKQPHIIIAFSGCCHSNSKLAVKRIEEMKNIGIGWKIDNIVGSPNFFQERLLQIKENFGIDEFVFLDMSDSQKNRLRTLELLSSKFDLQNA